MNTETKRPERELTLTRTVAAPRELVWAAWTQAEHLKKWWGQTDLPCPRANATFE